MPPQPLEGVGRGARLERAAAQQVRARLFDGLRHGDDLLLAFHGARPRDHAEITAADLHIAHLDDGVLRVELPVAAFERVADLLDRFHDIQAADEIHIYTARIADQAEHGMIRADGNMHAELLRLQPVDQLAALFL